MLDKFNQLVEKARDKQSLTKEEATVALEAILSGRLYEYQIEAFLVAMHEKEETPEELAAFALKMREVAQGGFSFPDFSSIDTCGTGGGAIKTFNVSTAVAFVLAAADLKVAKHGNRAITSQSGSADALQALGINIELPIQKAADCLREVGMCFLYAPVVHQAMANVQKVRKKIPHKTFFNLLGPLTNPASPAYQVIGVYKYPLVRKIAEVTAQLPIKRVMVVYGESSDPEEGMDEFSSLGISRIADVREGNISEQILSPKDFGIKWTQKGNLHGGTPSGNAYLIEKILKGEEKGPKRDIVALNAAAGLFITGKAVSFDDGMNMARQILKNGVAYEKVEALREFSNSV